MIYFTSDTHFCHNKDFAYWPRGFDSIQEADETLARNWNNVVKPDDEVYHLGDVMLNDNERGIEILKSLNGRIHIITGNHDTDARIKLYSECPNVVECGKYADIIRYGKYHFYLSHYPTVTCTKSFMSPKMVLINLHGHTHQVENFHYPEIPYMYHVGVDSHNNTPVSAEEVITDIKNRVARLSELALE